MRNSNRIYGLTVATSFAIAVVVAGGGGGGCITTQTASTKPAGGVDAARNDPYNYSPQMEDPNISGGAINNFDKNAMKRDLDHVFNP